MAALNFPTNPNNGDVYGGYEYNAAKGVWVVIQGIAPATIDGLTDVSVDPAVADDHTLLYNSTSGLWESSAIPASAITSGTFDIARIPTGTTSSTVSLGNHTHVANDLPDLDDLNGTLDIASGGTGATTVAGAQSALGMPLSPNYIINGAFDIWQRGTSATIDAANNYKTADRWSAYRNGGNGTESRQAAGLTGFQYCARIQRNSGNAALDVLWINQSIETVNSLALAGKTVTLSFYARAGSNYSGASNVLSVFLKTGTGTDQNVLAGFTGALTPIAVSAVLTTSWQRFTYTASLSSSLTQVGLQFAATPTGTAGANDYFEITGVQLEEGSTATSFRRNANSIQGELAACQRYFWRHNPSAGGNNVYGVKSSGTQAEIKFFHPVFMRAAPSSITVYAIGTVYSYNANSFVTPTNWLIPVSAIDHATISTTGVTVPGTAGTSVAVDNMSIGFNAEL